MIWLTKSHYFGKICRSKLDHDRIGVTIYDFSVVGVAVGDIIL
jgi:hypothetical protein